MADFASLWWLWLVLALLLGAQSLRVWSMRLWRRFNIRRRQRVALAGERSAEQLLVAHGFRVTGSQVTHQYVMQCDGDPYEVTLRADYLVERDGARYLAEVKTGRAAPSLKTAATRRQLLEYAHGYAVDGVLLVNMTEARIRQVSFPLAASGRAGPRRWQLAVAAAIGALLALLGQGLAS